MVETGIRYRRAGLGLVLGLSRVALVQAESTDAYTLDTADAARLDEIVVTGSLIRDTEIEGIIREWVDPVFVSMGLNPTDVEVLLVNDHVQPAGSVARRQPDPALCNRQPDAAPALRWALWRLCS